LVLSAPPTPAGSGERQVAHREAVTPNVTAGRKHRNLGKDPSYSYQ
jgi:hypothetical protein